MTPSRPPRATKSRGVMLGAPVIRPQTLHPLIEKAAAEVLRGWAQALGESFDPEETGVIIDWLAETVDLAAKDIPPQRGEGASALARFLLDRLGSVVLSLLDDDRTIDRAEAVRLMRGVDQVRRAIEPDWDRYFSSQLSGPDGLNLVVEVAHDIRSPLTSIRCLAETLERGQSGPVTDVQRQQLRLIYSASLGLSSLATDVIEIARRGDQLADGDPIPFSVSEVLEGVVQMVRPIAEEKGLSVKFALPSTDQRIGMPIALSRVLLNLVTNALKFTDSGSVEVSTRPTSLTRLEFSVRDTGRGIPEEAQSALFQPFRRSQVRAGRSGFFFSGTGLGLAMCRKLLGVMDSELKFETKAGDGTRFYFELDLPPVTRL
ncbi:MAG: HAMP domain-containing histidine kinase [Gemmatimonadetes bacterium]|nr:HAMP domain-containing histidine kinase [Gemmatimonadota bacterium]